MSKFSKLCILVASILIVSTKFVFAAETVLTEDDFESYSVTAQYGKLSKITMEGQSGTASMAYNRIINGPGSILTPNYEGNAAQNLITYAKTADDTGIAVAGGLGNGWEGRYSHPMNGLAGGGGADSDFNEWNRRCAVQSVGDSKVLTLNPANNAYVNTFSFYAYDNVDFSKYIAWNTKLNIRRIGAGGEAVISLTKGELSEAILFTNITHESGRTAFLNLVEFTADNKIKLLGTEEGTYATDTYYDVDIYINAGASTPNCIIQITDSETQSVVASTVIENLNFSFDAQTGVEYFAYTEKGASTDTQMDIDSFKISHVDITGALAEDSDIKINGTGECTLTLDTAVDENTVNSNTITVTDGKSNVEDVLVSVDDTKKMITFQFPALNPASDYTINVNGVKGENGVVANFSVPFKTIDLLTIGIPIFSNGTVSVPIVNNSAVKSPIEAIVAPYNNGVYNSGCIYYKTVDFAGNDTVNLQFDVTADQNAQKFVFYFLDSIKNGFRAVGPSVEVENY